MRVAYPGEAADSALMAGAGILPGLAEAPAPDVCLRLVLLGRMEAWGLASTAVLPRSRKARALLAVLGLAADAAVPRRRLSALLWSQRAEAQARGSLRQALHELQEALGEAAVAVLRADRDSVRLRAAGVWVDALEVARASVARPEALGLLERRGELLADLDGLDPAFDAWLGDQRRRLQGQAVAAAGAVLAAAGDDAARAAAAQRLLALDPADEAAWQALHALGMDVARGAPPSGTAAGPGAGETGICGEAALPAPPGIGPGTGQGAAGGDPALPLASGGDPGLPPGRWRPARAGGEAAPGLAIDGGGPAGPAPLPALAPALAPAGPRRGTRLGVLPLRPLGPEVPPHLAFGLAESVTDALARFRWIFVADCASLAAAAQAGGAERPDQAAARALGLDFLLAGTIQPGSGPGRLRIAFRLADLRDSAGAGIAWAEHFDRDAGDLLALQDAVAAEVVARMDPEILLIEAGRAAAAPHHGPEAGSAYDLLLRAMPALQSLDRAEFLQAGRLLAEAARRDPEHAAIHAWHAYWYLFLVGQGWAEAEDAAMAEAERLAARAVALDPMDAQGLTILGHVRAFLHHRIEEALALHRRALALNPNLAMAWVFLGMAESYAGAHESALRRLDRYRDLAPCHPHAFFFDAAAGIPLLLLGRHEEAVAVGRAASALQPGLSYPYKTYLSALGHLGLREEAEQVRTRLLAIEPGFTVAEALRRTPVRRPVDRAHYARGLRRAGLG